jgi:hypothetical protein
MRAEGHSGRSSRAASIDRTGMRVVPKPAFRFPGATASGIGAASRGAMLRLLVPDIRAQVSGDSGFRRLMVSLDCRQLAGASRPGNRPSGPSSGKSLQ